MKNILQMIALSLFLLTLSAGYASDFRVGVVDTERILRESAPAVQAEKKIEKEFEQRDLEMKRVAKQAKEIQIYFDKEGLTPVDVEHRSKERELANLNVTLQRMQREFREDLNLRKNEELACLATFFISRSRCSNSFSIFFSA